MRVELVDRPDIYGVLVDGKAIAGAVAFDLEAGYVEVEVPDVPKLRDERDGAFEVDEEEVIWTRSQLYGKVQLIKFRKQ